LKKTVAIVLLFSLVFNIVGYRVVYFFRQREAKAEMQNFLRSMANRRSEIPGLLLFQEEDLKRVRWEDDGKEFEMNEEMYDIIERRFEDGKSIIVCISDKNETALIKKFEKLRDQAQGSSQSQSNTILKLMFSPYFVSDLDYSFVLDDESNLQFLYPPSFISSINREILTPPPQLS